MKSSPRWSTLFVLTLLVGCTSATGGDSDDDDQEDGIDDSFGDGKGDSPSIVDGSREACGVLHVANTATLDELDHDAALSRRTATNIVNGRSYATIAALDAVPYVGPVALKNLLAYAVARGDVAACGSTTPPPTCPAPTAAFTWSYATGASSGSSSGAYSNALLQAVDGEPTPRVVYGVHPAGSFGEITARISPSQTRTYVNQGLDIDKYDDIAVLGGSDPCVSYVDASARLHVKCDSFGDRIAAVNVRGGTFMNGGLGLARTSSQLQLIYVEVVDDAHPSRLVWFPYTVDASTGATLPGPSEAIAGMANASVSLTRLAIDSAGRPHVAFVYNDAAGHFAEYATRTSAGWTRTRIADIGEGSINALSLALVQDHPVIAFHSNSKRSLEYAVQLANGMFSVSTLVAPPSQFPNDAAGLAIDLQTDACGGVWAVYKRAFTTDPTPEQLVVGKITGSTISYVPLPSSNKFAGIYLEPHDLSLSIDSAGHQFVAALGVLNERIYFASR